MIISHDYGWSYIIADHVQIELKELEALFLKSLHSDRKSCPRSSFRVDKINISIGVNVIDLPSLQRLLTLSQNLKPFFNSVFLSESVPIEYQS